jgi:hypothetical protein
MGTKVFPGLRPDAEALFALDRARRDEVLERGIPSPEHAAFVARLERNRARRRRRGAP